MASIMDDIIAETKAMNAKMPLLELLAEENMITELLRRRRFDLVRKRLQTILRSEIEKIAIDDGF